MVTGLSAVGTWAHVGRWLRARPASLRTQSSAENAVIAQNCGSRVRSGCTVQRARGMGGRKVPGEGKSAPERGALSCEDWAGAAQADGTGGGGVRGVEPGSLGPGCLRRGRGGQALPGKGQGPSTSPVYKVWVLRGKLLGNI